MKCSLFFLSAALALAQAEPLTKCQTPGHVALIVSGLPKKEKSGLLKSLKDTRANLFFTKEDLLGGGHSSKRIKDTLKKLGKKKRGQIGFRFTTKDSEGKTHKLATADIANELESAKQQLRQITAAELKFVLFPATADEEEGKRLVDIAKQVGLTAVKQNVQLEAHNVSGAVRSIRSTIKEPKSESYITLIDGTADNQNVVIDALKERVRHKKFKLVDLVTCAGGTLPHGKAFVAVKSTAPHHEASSSGEAETANGHKKGSKATPVAIDRKILVNPSDIKGFEGAAGKFLKSPKAAHADPANQADDAEAKDQTDPKTGIKYPAKRHRVDLQPSKEPIRVKPGTASEKTSGQHTKDAETKDAATTKDNKGDADKSKANQQADSATGLVMSVAPMAAALVAGLFTLL